jgi:hypothetical protein
VDKGHAKTLTSWTKTRKRPFSLAQTPSKAFGEGGILNVPQLGKCMEMQTLSNNMKEQVDEFVKS